LPVVLTSRYQDIFRGSGFRMNPVLTLALRSLVRNRRRSAIALAAVGFGVAALILADGFVDSLLVKLREDTIYSQLGHIQIRDPKFGELGLSEPYAHLLPTADADMAPVAGLPHVRVVAPRLALSGLVSLGDTTLSFTADAIDPAKEAMFDRGLAITEGAALGADDKEAVILGEGLAANLGAKTGDKVVLLVNAATGTLNAREFVVRGTFSSISKLYDDTGLRLPLASAQRLLRISGAQQWVILLDDTDKTAATLEGLRAVLPKARFALTRWDDEADFYHKTAQLFARQFGFIRVVVTAIIVLSILNTMTMNVLERTWEIGVMLALGDSRRQVLALFACEGALLGFAGGLLGAALGLAAAAVLNAVGIPMPAPPGMSHGFDAGVLVSAAQVAAAFAIGCAAAAIASLPPAARASRLRVVDALRVTH